MEFLNLTRTFVLLSKLFAARKFNKSALLSISERNVRMTNTYYMKWYYDRIHRELGKTEQSFLFGDVLPGNLKSISCSLKKNIA